MTTQVQHHQDYNGSLHPKRSLVAAGRNQMQMTLRNYRLGGLPEGSVKFDSVVKQIIWTPCGGFLAAITADGRMELVSSNGLRQVAAVRMADKLKANTSVKDWILDFEYTQSGVLRFVWVLANLWDSQAKQPQGF